MQINICDWFMHIYDVNTKNVQRVQDALYLTRTFASEITYYLDVQSTCHPQ